MRDQFLQWTQGLRHKPGSKEALVLNSDAENENVSHVAGDGDINVFIFNKKRHRMSFDMFICL